MRRQQLPFKFRSHRHPRSGVVVVLFAVLLFVLLPLAALVIDMAYVQLTRHQMQTAVNTAALEGLRLRDSDMETLYNDPPPDLVAHCGMPPDEESAEYENWLECARRWSVKRHVGAVYDDNLNSDSDDAMNFGAGPLVTIDGGVTPGGTNFRALTKVSVPDVFAYKPDLQLNGENETHGDMVRGDYLPNGLHKEENDYTRDGDGMVSGDFTPNESGDAFLVRLRRTNNPNFLDGIPDTSSFGPPVPFLFGRGGITRALGPDPAALWNQRERGSIVRATAIAHASPAMTVGPYSDDAGAGTAPIWVEKSQWDLLANDADTPLTISGTLLRNAGGTVVIGEYVTRQIVTVGDSLGSGTPENISGERYVPIYQIFPSDNRYVIGFGIAELSLEPSTGMGSITRKESRIGEANAAAYWRANLGSLSASDLNELLSTRSSQEEPLLAPALVRTIE